VPRHSREKKNAVARSLKKSSSVYWHHYKREKKNKNRQFKKELNEKEKVYLIQLILNLEFHVVYLQFHH